MNCKHPDQYPLEIIAAMQMTGAPPGVLRLKVGARYMIIKNMQDGVFNGVRCQLISFAGTMCVFVKLLSGPGIGTTILLPRCVFTISTEASGLPFNVRRRQFPLIPAFAVTVHKAQGQTLQRVGLYLTNPIFTHGQLYTAMSRTRGWQHITVFSQLPIPSHVNNCVCKHVLRCCDVVHDVSHELKQ
jgi:ATP-dependent DNA helicase PIF1